MVNTCPACLHQTRRRARFCDRCGIPLDGPIPPLADHDRSVEQRHATFLFCDLVHSTQLANTLDLEDLRRVFRQFRYTVAEVAKRHAGHLTRFVGDGAFMSFGYPEAREDAPDSAVRAGLDLVRSVRSMAPMPGVSLDLRVGIASGTVAVGDLIDEAAVKEESVIGSAPHLAARLVAEAPPGGVLIADSTQRLAAGFFEYRDLGPLQLKGFDDAVRAWIVVAETNISSRFEAKQGATPTSELVGRTDSLAQLTAAWLAARDGHGSTMTVIGEAGIGKSRLTQTVIARAVRDGSALLELDCTPRTSNTPLYPVSVLLRRIAGIPPTDPEDTRIERMGLWMRTLLGAERGSESTYYLAPLFGLTAVASSVVESPDRVRERTIGLLVEIVVSLARRSTVVLVCEDMHWADATTALLLHEVAARIGELPVLMILTTRTVPPASELAIPQIVLPPLDAAAAHAVVSNAARGETLPPVLVDWIVQRSEGVPLFLEELTRSAVESARRGDAAALSVAVESSGEGGVPATLQTVVQSRLGRWPDLKPTVQAASVLGREFPLRLLEQLLSDSGTKVRIAVERLVEHGLIAATDAMLSQPLRFKHALIHEAVYQTMLRSDRQRLHSRTAEILQQHYVGAPESAPDVLAHHLVVAQRFDEAVRCLTAASAETVARAAYVESIGHSRAALTLIDKLDKASSRTGLQRQLLTQLGVALSATRGYATSEVEQTYQQARLLCEVDADPVALFPIVRGLATFYFVRCDLRSADQLASQCIKLAGQAQRDDLMIEALSFRGYASVYLGRLNEGRVALDNCIALYRSRRGEMFTYPSPQDAGTAAWSLLGIAAWLQGDTQASDTAVADALGHAERLARPFDQAYVHVWIAMLRNMQRRFDEAQMHATACIEICTRHGFNSWLVAATMHSCISRASLSASEESIAVLRQALGAFIQAGAQANAPFFLWGVARGLRMTGQADEAREAIAEAKQRADATGEAYLKSELLMLEAEGESDAARAQALLTEAMEMAESQGAVLLALRAALHLLKRVAPEQEHSYALRSASQALEGTAPYPVAQNWVQVALGEARRALARIDASQRT